MSTFVEYVICITFVCTVIAIAVNIGYFIRWYK